MEYMDFLNAVRDYINETAQDVSVSIHTAQKNNGVMLSGLTFSQKGYNASPTIYMDNYYTEYIAGRDINEIGDSLLSLYYENDLATNYDISFFDDFGYIKDRLFIKLINRKKNEDFLKQAPHEDFLDLSIVAYVRIYDKKMGNGLIMVRNEHLDIWDEDAETVINIAKKNTHDREEYNITHIVDVLGRLGGGIMIPECERSQIPMYVATNRRMTYGAAVMTMSDKLKEFGTVIGSDYVIIPSSVNELILVPNGNDDFGDIDSMIREVNETQLGPDDILADHAYMYSIKDEVLIF